MTPIIVWFRQDLRLSDNAAFTFAARSGKPVICLYVLDDETPGDRAIGGASRWWLHHSLTALNAALAKKGGGLVLKRGRAEDVVTALVRETGADSIAWNRCYEPFAAARDARLEQGLLGRGVSVETCKGALLFEPGALVTLSGKPFKVFTPFWKALRAKPEPAMPSPAPDKIALYAGVKSDALEDWALLPRHPDWAAGFDGTPGETAAQQALRDFLDRIDAYVAARDQPGLDGTSRLSPHLHWGEISPRQVWHAVRARAPGSGSEKFLSELAWREFNTHLLAHNPELAERPYDPRFAAFPWRKDDVGFRAWTRGQTGIPIVDAGMRQLWQTGWMHNRVRMIVASFLVKHLLIDWRQGETWFWDTLVDADLANNAANWQWVAGSGADAAPFFRIFNPVLQGEKFDTAGAYVRSFVPELRTLPDKYIHKPWEAPQPPANYPAPIVGLAAGRDRALAAFKSLTQRA